MTCAYTCIAMLPPLSPLPTQRYFSLDDRIAWGYYEFSTDLLSERTIEEWVALSGKQGEGQEGHIHIIISFTVRSLFTL